jgi:hypothetical protein
MANQQSIDVISYTAPNSVPPSHMGQHMDRKSSTIDNDSDKQATDRNEIESSSNLCYTEQENVERSQSSTETTTTSDESANYRQNADSSGSLECSLSPQIPQQEPEKGVINSTIQGSAKHIRRLYEGSDIRICEDCGRKGDKWEMEVHKCNRQ